MTERAFFSGLSLSLSLSLLPALTSAGAAAQEAPRTAFTFHVYVDANFGDNEQAWLLNPGQTGQPLPLDVHPDNLPPQKPIQGVLQHAPYAFKSLTTTGTTLAETGVLDWIAGNFPTLPWSHPSNDKTVDYVVIHVLPGVYGPRPAGGPGLPIPYVDPRSGMQVSGEVWPVRLPDRVSLQGTSALDCVLHGFRWRGDASHSPIIEVTGSHENSFIDSLTIRSAKAAGSGGRGGAAIYVGGVASGGEVACSVTVSNCFLFENDVGIAVDSRIWEKRTIHRPRIINNTIAWNRCGMWNGDMSQSPTQGYNELAVLNNVFDASPPPGYPVPGLTGFEGMSDLDLCVVNPTVRDFNAWELGKVNLGVAIPGTGYPASQPRVAWSHPNNQVDIAPITITGGRGILYVNDLLRATVGDLSPHDFRLVPMVSNTSTQPPTQLNPLVNAGRTITVPNPIVMRNQTIVLSEPPGLPANAEDVPATLHCWDWDCDGYGNERVRERAGFASQPWNIDIGADELDALLVTGFIESTRIFSRNVPNTMGIADHTRIFFVDMPSGTFTRPTCNILLGRSYWDPPSSMVYFTWWPHTQALPSPAKDVVSATNHYTYGTLDTSVSRRRTLTTAVSNPQPPFMRGLECDFSPHLLPDPHPFWGALFQWKYPVGPDIHANSPWYRSTRNGTNMLGGRIDNPFVYYNPGSSGTPSQTEWAVSYHAIKVGLVSPPGTEWKGVPPQVYLAQGPTYTFDLCPTGGPHTLYDTDSWGIGDVQSGCPDVAPDSSLFGVRYNLQRLGGSPSEHSNVQTLLTINDDTQPASYPAPGMPAISPTTADDVRRTLRVVDEWESIPRRRR